MNVEQLMKFVESIGNIISNYTLEKVGKFKVALYQAVEMDTPQRLIQTELLTYSFKSSKLQSDIYSSRYHQLFTAIRRQPPTSSKELLSLLENLTISEIQSSIYALNHWKADKRLAKTKFLPPRSKIEDPPAGSLRIQTRFLRAVETGTPLIIEYLSQPNSSEGQGLRNFLSSLPTFLTDIDS